MAAPTAEPPIRDSITNARLAEWADQDDHVFRRHRSRLAAAAPKIATLIATPNPFVSDHCRLLAEVAIDRGDDPIDVLVTETMMSRKEIDQIAETVSGYADTHWVEVLGVLGRKTKMKREVIERIARANPKHIGVNWRDHPEELHSLLSLCPTLALPDTEEQWDALHRYWTSRGRLAKDSHRLPKLGYLVDLHHLYRQRYPDISFDELDAMFGGKCDLSRVWGYSEFVSKLLDSDANPNVTESPCVPFLSQYEPAELVKQAELCHTEMVRLANAALRSRDETFDDWPRLIQGVFKSHSRTAASLVTPAELIREGAMLSTFLAAYPGDFVSGHWHVVAVQSPEGLHLSTAEFILHTECDRISVSCVAHFDLAGNEPSPECARCVEYLEWKFNNPDQNDRLGRLLQRFVEPDQTMKTMLTQFKLKSAALGMEALSAVLSCYSGAD